MGHFSISACSISFLTLFLFVALTFQAEVIVHPWRRVVEQVSLSSHNLSTSPPPSSFQSRCPSLRVRKEWRRLTNSEKVNYIKSVNCLVRQPSKLLGSSYRRWDDFQYLHHEKRRDFHANTLFLPAHRYFLHLYEKTLREECGFSAPMPYWDWTLDAANVTRSPIFSSDANIGFGTNGTLVAEDSHGLDGRIVADGAFAKFPIYYPVRMRLMRNISLGDPFVVTDHVLGSQWYDSENVKRILSETKIVEFLKRLEGNYMTDDGVRLPGPHSIIHTLLGGTMSDLGFAANDPIFHLHHCQIDRLWSMWQEAAPASRMYQYEPMKGKKTSLNDTMDFVGLAPSVKVRSAMSNLVPPYCYRYE